MYEEITEIKNYTPHVVSVLHEDKMVNIPISGSVIRVVTRCTPNGYVMGLPIFLCTDGQVADLPEPEQGVMILVSSVVARAAMRPDVISPDTSDAGSIRDGNGRIIGVKRFQCFV